MAAIKLIGWSESFLTHKTSGFGTLPMTGFTTTSSQSGTNYKPIPPSPPTPIARTLAVANLI